MIEDAVITELFEHLGYEKQRPRKLANAIMALVKTVSSADGQLTLKISRDRDGSFEPQLIKKAPNTYISMDDQILSLYAKGMTSRDVVAFFEEIYDADVSVSLISKVTDAVIEQVTE